MSVNDQARRSGREPITLAELDLDRCTLRYGHPPCMAAIGVTGTTQCYNTRATCQDPEHYSPAPFTYRYCTPQANLPLSLAAVPCLKSASLTATKIDVAGGLGQRASVTLQLQDFPYHDRGLDPYYRIRGGAPHATPLQAGPGLALQAAPGLALQALPDGARAVHAVQGTYWGRMRGRTPYYQARVCRVLTGYLVDGEFDIANFYSRTYLLESIAGPDPAGSVQIKAKDPLKLADDDRAQAPLPSEGVLVGDMAIDDLSFTLGPVDTGAGGPYGLTGWIRIGSEVMEFIRTGDNFTVERAQFGTIADTHSSGDSVQLCLRYAARTIPEILYDLLHTYAAIDDVFLPVAEWEVEASTYLTRTYSTLITAPTPIKTLIKELSEQGPFSIWYAERDAVIRIRALRSPTSDSVILNDEQHILQGSLTVTDKPELRVSQAWVYLAQADPTHSLDEVRNYRQLVIDADLEAEGVSKFRAQAIKVLYSRWLTSRSNASELALRLVQLFGEQPRQVAFSLDAKDASIWTGDIVRIRTRLVQDPDGAEQLLGMQIIQANEEEAGHRFSYVAQAFNFGAPIATGLTISIAVDTNDVNLRDLFVSRLGFEPSPATQVLFVIEAGVIVGQELAEQALIDGTWPVGSKKRLEVNGRISGKGGRGAGYNDGALQSGEDGGTAIVLSSFTEIDNAGEIWGGGGGGYCERNTPGSSVEYNAGGGGAGTIPGPGGTAATLDYFDGDFTVVGAGADGTSNAGGAGYAGDEKEGGFGGGPGEDADNSEVGSDDIRGGAGGYYLKGNSFVTWISTGDRRGRVS